MKSVILLAVALAVSGCASGGFITGLGPVCEALDGPIRYNHYKPASPNYAGPGLAPQLAQRNQIGENLGCPEFKK